MTKFIDIHTHQLQNSSDIQVLVSKEEQDDCLFVYGIHPWDLTTFDEKQFIQVSGHKNFIGLGEIGLDKLRPGYEKQINIFEQQVRFAVDQNIKLLVLHNIMANDDIIKTLKQHKYTGAILLHDFNQSLESFEQFNRIVKTYVSTGQRLLTSSKTQSLFLKLPKEHIFFETDDSNLEIDGIYEAFSNIAQIPLKDLKEQIQTNFTNLVKLCNIQH